MTRLIIASAALLLAISVNAQGEPKRKAFSAGPIMGMGHAWMTPTAHSAYNPAMSAGIFAIYSPVEHWGIGMDVRYSIEGSKRVYPEGVTVNQDFHYLRVPLSAIYFFGKWGDDFRPKIAVGPSLGFLIGSDTPSYISENTLDFGLHASAGFNYRIYGNTWLNADLGCYHGFTDAIENTNNKEYQNNIMVNLGIGFEI